MKTSRNITGGGPAYIATGGFPCQPFSAAGKRKGAQDDRHLWPHMLRVIQEVRPTWFIGENVAGLVNMGKFDSAPPVDDHGVAVGNIGEIYSRTGPGLLKEIVESLEEADYQVQPFLVPAVALDARHIRYRVWIVANTDRDGFGTLHRFGSHSEAPRETQGAGKVGQRIRSVARRGGADMADAQRIGRDIGREQELEISQKERSQSAVESPRRRSRAAENLADTSGGRLQRRGLPVRSRQSLEAATDVIGNGKIVPDTDSVNGKRRDAQRSQGRAISKERSSGLRDSGGGWDYQEWPAEPRVGRVAHGIPNRVDRIKALGNTIVPKVAETFMRAIKYADQ